MTLFRLVFAVIISLMMGAIFANAVENSVKRPDIDQAWARATTMEMHAGAVYVSITNASEQDDVLMKVESDIAADIMLHTTLIENDIAKMRHLEKIEIPAGDTVGMEPGGMHIMLMGLQKALVKGESFPITFVFEKAGRVTVDVGIK